jgi:hypothetical protein
LHRLPLVESCNDKQVHAKDGGIKPKSKDIIQEHVEDNLEGGHSTEATTKTASTGGQQQNSESDACQTKK